MRPQIKLVTHDYHRNGVCGNGFFVSIFDDPKEGRMLAIDFHADDDQEHHACFAVLNIEKLCAGDIAFMSNSWRGDHYWDAVRDAVKEVR